MWGDSPMIILNEKRFKKKNFITPPPLSTDFPECSSPGLDNTLDYLNSQSRNPNLSCYHLPMTSSSSSSSSKMCSMTTAPSSSFSSLASSSSCFSSSFQNLFLNSTYHKYDRSNDDIPNSLSKRYDAKDKTFYFDSCCLDNIKQPSSSLSPRTKGLFNNQKRSQSGKKEWSEIGISVYRVGTLGMYHSSVVVDNIEWHFWESLGVQPLQRYYDHIQQTCVSISHMPLATYIPIDTLMISPEVIARLCIEFGFSMFSIHTYDLVQCNCNHFTETILNCLGLGSKMPRWINRLANTTDSVCTFFPFMRNWLNRIFNKKQRFVSSNNAFNRFQ